MAGAWFVHCLFVCCVGGKLGGPDRHSPLLRLGGPHARHRLQADGADGLQAGLWPGQDPSWLPSPSRGEQMSCAALASHTQGIGSKLMVQMGYKQDCGLGRTLAGSQAPLEVSQCLARPWHPRLVSAQDSTTYHEPHQRPGKFLIGSQMPLGV